MQSESRYLSWFAQVEFIFGRQSQESPVFRFRYRVGRRKQTSRFIRRILPIDLLSRAIFSHCPPSALLRLMRTSSIVHDEVTRYMQSAFNINRILSRFFEDTTSFRSLQAQTGTLISGSTALQFFDRSSYPGSDLDIYVHMAWRETVGCWLHRNGYEFVPNDQQSPDFHKAINDTRFLENEGIYFMRGVAGVFNFVKKVSDEEDSEELKVQMIVAAGSPMEVILYFHSSESCHTSHASSTD